MKFNLIRCIKLKTFFIRSKSEPEPEPAKKSTTNESNDTSEKELPPLQKVDNAWLTGPTSTNDVSNQWDQPIQENIKSASPPTQQQHQQQQQQQQTENTLEDDIPVDFNALSLKEEENVPEA